MGRNVLWQEMFRDEFENAIAERPVCYFSFGLSEPHGPHNAMGLDGLKAYSLVQRVAEEHGGVVAPPVWWHVHETPHGLVWLSKQNAPKPYLTCMPAEIFLHQLVYQLRAAEAAGFRAAVCVTGHYGGIEVDMKMVCERYSKHRPLRAAALADWEAIRYKGLGGDHAGFVETSQLMCLRPELVDMSRFPDEKIEDKDFAAPEAARKASRREGEAIVATQVEYLNRLSDELLRQAQGLPSSERLTWDDTEKIWSEIYAERSKWISTHPEEGFAEYQKRRRAMFKLPVE